MKSLKMHNFLGNNQEEKDNGIFAFWKLESIREGLLKLELRLKSQEYSKITIRRHYHSHYPL